MPHKFAAFLSMLQKKSTICGGQSLFCGALPQISQLVRKHRDSSTITQYPNFGLHIIEGGGSCA